MASARKTIVIRTVVTGDQAMLDCDPSMICAGSHPPKRKSSLGGTAGPGHHDGSLPR